MHRMTQSVHYRADIDGLRAVAVLAVLLHHAWPERFRGGFVGVDIFFVISGFLITRILLDELIQGQLKLGEFYARRVRRIFPALLLVLGTALVVGWWWLIPVDYAAMARHVMGGAGFVANFFFWAEAGYFDEVSAGKPLLHLWSLAIEEQFYLVWPVLLWAVYRWRWPAHRVVVGLLLASFVLNLVLVRTDPDAAFFNPLARFWELMVGAWLAIRAAHGRQVVARNANVMAWFGIFLLVLAMVLVHPERRFPGGWALLPTLGTALLIAAGPSAWINRHILAARLMVAVGLISYPLYLWHWPLLVWSGLRNGEGSGPPGPWVVLAFLLALLTYWLLEKPVRQSRGARARLITWTMLVLMLCVAVFAGVTQLRNGFDGRFPSAVRTLTAQGGPAVVTQGWRYHDCVLDFRVPPSAYKPFCIEEKRPLLFIWGDSHAASLYPGFKALQIASGHAFGIAQRTGAVCPPILGFEPRPGCQLLNDANIQAIRDSRPEVVLLYAWWHHPRYELGGLEATVEAIRAAGVSRIVLLGPLPLWQKSLPQLLLEEWKNGPFSRPPPLRLKNGLDLRLSQISDEMRDRAGAMQIQYVDGLSVFCDADGCLTRLRDSSTEPLSYDYGHLAPEAVRHFVRQVGPLVMDGFWKPISDQ